MKLRSAVALACVFVSLDLARIDLRADDAASPESVMREAMAGFNSGQFGDFARGMHPEALQQFRKAMTAIVDAAAKEGKADQLLSLFPGVKTVDELKKLTDATFFADYLNGVTGRDPDLKKALASATIQALGEVQETKDLTHVVYRITTKVDGQENVIGPLVVSLSRDGKRWAMMLTGDIEMLTVMLEQRAKGKMVMPDPKTSKSDPIGTLIQGDEAFLVYRMTTPFGDSMIKKVDVLAYKKSDPGGKAIVEGNREALIKLLKEKAAK